MENITNSYQKFTINFPKEGYATFRVETPNRYTEHWFYLNNGDFELNLDGDDMEYFPFESSPSENGQEFIEYYKIKEAMSKSVMDSLNLAQREFDNSTRENVEDKAKNLNKWMEKNEKLQFSIIKTYHDKFPNSPNTIFILDQLGLVNTYTEAYVNIFNSLNNELKESKAGIKLLEQITRSSRMMAGSQMPNIEGQNPNDDLFDKKILKKVNLVIIWTSYNTKSRENNKMLSELYKKYKNQDVEFIGVSLDTKRNWWVNVIRDDKLDWPQYSDLKGAKSPNAKNLSDYNIPYFFLINKEGKVLMNNDLTTSFINDEIRKRL
ncbi:TlpA family protein disulfide reductase [Pedobacter ginsenosidimutans]|uniref:TlpA family protein disulfide reductase n=1 Tax=Pedobacter ginsenosidimutans TaxID=687842 RepID=UPI0014288BE3|nr:thioredoxin family protein [Pedobacter ginsenosidimutans]